MEDKLNDLLGVASGNKELKVGIDNNQIYLLGLVILISVLLGTFFGRKFSK